MSGLLANQLVMVTYDTALYAPENVITGKR